MIVVAIDESGQWPVTFLVSDDYDIDHAATVIYNNARIDYDAMITINLIEEE